MNVDYINPFLNAAISVFDTMLKSTLVRGKPFLKDGTQPDFEVSGLIGLSGKARGMVVLSLCREAALGVASILTGERCRDIDADVVDAVGEMTNMIAGSAKAHLEELQMSVSLPTVITGKTHCIDFPKNTKPICIPFDSVWGPVAVEVGLVE